MDGKTLLLAEFRTDLSLNDDFEIIRRIYRRNLAGTRHGSGHGTYLITDRENDFYVKKQIIG